MKLILSTEGFLVEETLCVEGNADLGLRNIVGFKLQFDRSISIGVVFDGA